MARTLGTAAVISLVASVLFTASHLIPFNLPALLVYYPLGTLIPELGHTGDAVEIGFAWVVIKQSWVWAVLFAYHFLLFLAIVAPITLLMYRR
jgi:hypothetical protein